MYYYTETCTAIQKLYVYKCVVDSLVNCANMFIPKKNKFWFCSQEFDVLKNNSVVSSITWKDAGKPRFGVICTEYKRNILIYKKRIREGYFIVYK